ALDGAQLRMGTEDDPLREQTRVERGDRGDAGVLTGVVPEPLRRPAALGHGLGMRRGVDTVPERDGAEPDRCEERAELITPCLSPSADRVRAPVARTASGDPVLGSPP